MNLLENVRIYKPNKASTHIQNVASTWVNCAGWNGVLFLLIQGATQALSTGTVIIQQSSALSTGAGILQTTFSDKIGLGSTNRMMAIDVFKPIKPFVRLRMLTCTGVQAVPMAYLGRMRGTTEAKDIVNRTSNQPSGVYACTT